MAVASAKITLDNVNKKYVVEDTTDYAGQSLTISDWTGRIALSVNSSSGDVPIYDNLAGATPDITPATDLINSILIPLLTGTDGLPVPGNYTLTYQLTNVTDTAVVITYTLAFAFNFTEPEVCIEIEVNCGSSLVKSTDTTDYLLSIVGQPSREHTLYPPPAAHIPDATVATAINIYNNIVTTTWTSEVISTCTWLLSSGVYYYAEITGVKEFEVNCSTNLCGILCCVEEVYEKWQGLVCSGNTIEAARYKDQYVLPTFICFMRFMSQQQCGNDTKAAAVLEEIKTVSGCTGDCGCNDEGPQVVIAQTSNASGTIVVASPNGTITVTPEIIANTQYYYVTLPPAIITLLGTIKTYLVVADLATPEIQVAATYPTATSVLYTVSFNGAIAKNPIIDMWLRVENSGGWIVTPVKIQAAGLMVTPLFTDFSFTLGDLSPGSPGVNDVVIIKIKDFFVNPQIFTCSANVIKYFDVGDASVLLEARTLKPFEAEINYSYMDTPLAEFYVRLCKPDGVPVLIGDLSSHGNQVDIHVQIIPQA